MYSNSAVDRCIGGDEEFEQIHFQVGVEPTSTEVPSYSLNGNHVVHFVSRLSSSTRNRTWNFSLEARDDIRFTIEPCCLQQLIEPTERKARESNPHNFYVALFSKQARRTVSGYLPYVSSGVTEIRTRVLAMPWRCLPAGP